MDTMTKTAQINLTRSSAAYWRITFDNPPLNLMGPQFVREFRDIMTAIEADEQVRVVVFDSAVEGFFLNHSDFFANFDDLKSIPPGPTQPAHPPDELSSVTSRGWAVITLLKFAMCFLFLVGITGIYARQVQQSGWIGLLGYLMFSLSWGLSAVSGRPYTVSTQF